MEILKFRSDEQKIWTLNHLLIILLCILKCKIDFFKLYFPTKKIHITKKKYRNFYNGKESKIPVQYFELTTNHELTNLKIKLSLYFSHRLTRRSSGGWQSQQLLPLAQPRPHEEAKRQRPSQGSSNGGASRHNKRIWICERRNDSKCLFLYFYPKNPN